MATLTPPQYLSVPEVAAMLGVADVTIRRALRRGEIPHIAMRHPQRVIRRIRRDHAEAYIEQLHAAAAE